MSTPYPIETLGEEEDDGTIEASRTELANAVVGHRIMKVDKEAQVQPANSWGPSTAPVITLDDGTQVELVGGSDCCAYTELESFLLHPELVDHVIMGVGTTDAYHKWHIYADAGDVLELDVGWSCGNPFYYAYGFDIRVKPVAA